MARAMLASYGPRKNAEGRRIVRKAFGERKSANRSREETTKDTKKGENLTADDAEIADKLRR